MKIGNEIGNVRLMQKINRMKVLECIRGSGTISRPEIAKITGLSPSSVTNIVSYLIDKNLIIELGPVDSKEVGRKATLMKFNQDCFHIISIEIETAIISVALTNLEGKILKIKNFPLGRNDKEKDILEMIRKEVELLIGESRHISNINIVGIGIGISGLIQGDEKLVISSSLRWKGISLKKFFEEGFKLPVYVQNNSKTKALSEFRTEQCNIGKNVIFLDLTMGVGIINYFDGKINEAVIGEFGHTTVKKDGPLCFCGNHGCLEVMCSVDSIISRCTESMESGGCRILRSILDDKKSVLNYDNVIEAFNKGDNDVHVIINECGEYLGIGIANIINIFNPQRIIINGDVLLNLDYIYETAVDVAYKRAYEQFTKDLEFKKVNIKVEQAIKGVSIYVADKFFEISGPVFN